MNIDMILLQAQQPQGSGSMWLWMIILLVLMWILMIRPQRKRQKEEENFRQGLKKGDRVTFSGGIHGKVMEVNDTTAEVEVSNGCTITVEKASLQPIAQPQQNQAKK